MDDTPGVVSEEENVEENVSDDNAESSSCNLPQVSPIPWTEIPFTNAIFKELSYMNGKINNMQRRDLINQLKFHKLNHKGDTIVLKKRLKNFHKVTKMTNANLMEKQNLLLYYVVIDFEATCQENNPVNFNYEIIEFPAILVCTETLSIKDVFHSYVKPVKHPKLSDFCKKLTGITQDQVDKSPEFVEVLKMFEFWLDSHNLLSSRKFLVTDGPWDMGRFLFLQCKLSKVKYPCYAKEWINLRKIFRNFYKYHQGGSLESMIEYLGIKFEGTPHRGLDDSFNIAKMFIRMLKDGALIRSNERITVHNRSHNNIHVLPVSYKQKLNNIDDVKSLRDEIEAMNINVNLSDTDIEQSESELESENDNHKDHNNEQNNHNAINTKQLQEQQDARSDAMERQKEKSNRILNLNEQKNLGKNVKHKKSKVRKDL